ncbi:adipolin isoform X2 [Festucalex cinctus]
MPRPSRPCVVRAKCRSISPAHAHRSKKSRTDSQLTLQAPAGMMIAADVAVPDVTPQLSSPADDVANDAISIAASGACFQDSEDGGDEAPSGGDSVSSAPTRQISTGEESVRKVMFSAFRRLKLDASVFSQPSAKCGLTPMDYTSQSFWIPECRRFVTDLQTCWLNPRVFPRLPADGRALARMRFLNPIGLERMPNVEYSIAVLVVSADKALRQDARCPDHQWRLTDELITKSYNTAAVVARLANAQAHLLLALSAALADGEVEEGSSFCNMALRDLSLLAREQGRCMSLLIQARRQVWLAQSPLREPSRKELHRLPVVPGQLFSSAATEALKRTLFGDDCWLGK